jgi:hypothetical protein
MLIQWAARYSSAAANSKRASQFGAFLILTIALIEVIYLARWVYAAEDLSWESVFSGPTGAVVTGAFLIAFGVRFVLLCLWAANLAVRSLTWWLAVGTCWFANEFYGPQPGVVYDLFHSFPLQTSGMVFVLVGSLRFLYFASVSFKNDLNPNS